MTNDPSLPREQLFNPSAWWLKAQVEQAEAHYRKMEQEQPGLVPYLGSFESSRRSPYVLDSSVPHRRRGLTHAETALQSPDRPRLRWDYRGAYYVDRSRLKGAVAREVTAFGNGSMWEVTGPHAWLSSPELKKYWEEPSLVWLREGNIYVQLPGDSPEKYTPPETWNVETASPTDVLVHMALSAKGEPRGSDAWDGVVDWTRPVPETRASSREQLFQELVPPKGEQRVAEVNGAKYVLRADVDGIVFEPLDGSSRSPVREVGNTPDGLLLEIGTLRFLVQDDGTVWHQGRWTQQPAAKPLTDESFQQLREFLQHRDALWAEARKLNVGA